MKRKLVILGQPKPNGEQGYCCNYGGGNNPCGNEFLFMSGKMYLRTSFTMPGVILHIHQDKQRRRKAATTVLNNLRYRYIILTSSVIAIEAFAISCFRYANADLALQKLLLHFLLITLGPLYGMFMNAVNNFSFTGILIAVGLFVVPFAIVRKGAKKFSLPLLFLGSSFWVFCGYLYAVAMWM